MLCRKWITERQRERERERKRDMEITVFWDVTPCSLMGGCYSFRGNFSSICGTEETKGYFLLICDVIKGWVHHI
jgi:hypothetical protein